MKSVHENAKETLNEYKVNKKDDMGTQNKQMGKER